MPLSSKLTLVIIIRAENQEEAQSQQEEELKANKMEYLCIKQQLKEWKWF